jgi:hypothetical protein
MLYKIAPGLMFWLMTGMASASVLTSQANFYANGSQGGSPQVQSTAAFAFTNVTPTTGILTVTLTNLLADPTSVAQDITDFNFKLVDGNGVAIAPTCASNCLTSASATAGTVTFGTGGTPTYSSGATDPHWAVSLNASTFYLNGQSPLHSSVYAIMGPGGSGGYRNANTSITGSYSPFIYSTATWTFTLSNLPANFSVAGVNFSYNSGYVNNFSCDADPAHCGGGSVGQNTADPIVSPEPVSFLLAGSGLMGLILLRRWRA